MNCVLVVDDEPAIRNLERVILKSAGYQVLTASNGAEALELLERSHPAVVVLDMQMPVMDGRSLFKMLDSRGERPAVLVVANEAGRAQRELGAEACLEKPFAPEDLLARIEALHPELYESRC
ncbi:MAG: response regulator transcription factor [Dehalococcoidia bacterium]